MSERTPEEREAARRERERRRAERAGRPWPPEPEPEPAPAESWLQVATQDIPAPAAAAEQHPHATQQYDVTRDWTDEHAVAPTTERDDVTEDWTNEHAVAPASAADPEVPLGTRRVSAHERLAEKRHHLHRPHLPRRRPRRAPGAPRPSRGWGARVAAGIALALVLVAGWFLLSLFQPFKGSGSGRVVVRVPAGASASQIGDLLAAKGVVSSSFFFRLRATLDGARGDLRSGTFTLRHGMSYGAAIGALTHAPPSPPVLNVTIPEGRSRREAAALVKADGLRGSYFVATRRSRLLSPRRYGAPRGATLEGFLFPATYELRPHASVETLVAKQLAAFKDAFAKLDLRAARRKNLTAFDIVTIASMVEREVSVAKERPLVAAVIYNRMHYGMPLGIDATLRFALNDWTHPLRASQLASRTPYNTRNHHGLPPGPIGNPGLASLRAAAHPARVKHLFYVVKPGTCGEHAFSSTDAQFQRDVTRYNRARAAAGGKSPTKC